MKYKKSGNAYMSLNAVSVFSFLPSVVFVAVVVTTLGLAMTGIAAEPAKVKTVQAESDEVVQKRKAEAVAAKAKADAARAEAGAADRDAHEAEVEKVERDRDNSDADSERLRARAHHEAVVKESLALFTQLEQLQRARHIVQVEQIVEELEASSASDPGNKNKKDAAARWRADLEKEKQAHPDAVKEVEVRNAFGVVSGRKVDWRKLIQEKQKEYVEKGWELKKLGALDYVNSGRKIVAGARAKVADVKKGYRERKKSRADQTRKSAEKEADAQEVQAEKLELKDGEVDSLASKWAKQLKRLKRSCAKHEMRDWMGFRVAGDKVLFTKKLAADYKIFRDGNKSDREKFGKIYALKFDCEQIPKEEDKRRECEEWQTFARQERDVEACRKRARTVLALEKQIAEEGKAIQASDRAFEEKKAAGVLGESSSMAGDCDPSAGSCNVQGAAASGAQ